MTTQTTQPFTPSTRKVLFNLGKYPVHKPRRPKIYLNDITAGEAAFPIVVLFGLNAVNQLDTSAFATLTPECSCATGGHRILTAPRWIRRPGPTLLTLRWQPRAGSPASRLSRWPPSSTG